MAACDGGGAQSRLPHNGHDYVWAPGATQALGAPSYALEAVAGANWRLYRICAAAICAYGGSGVLERSRAQGSNVPRSRSHACSCAARAVSTDHQHPGVMGEDGSRRRQNLSAIWGKRHGWDTHEREYYPRSRWRVWSGVAA